MDPDEVFKRFNEIIGPNFSLTTGRRLSQSHTVFSSGDSTGGDTRHQEDLAGTASGTAVQVRLGRSGKESDEGIPKDQELSSVGELSRSLHGMLFRPKELVYIKRNPGSRTEFPEQECVLVTSVKEIATSDEDDTAIPTHDLRYIRACHTGHRFGLTNHTLKTGSSSDEIVNLTVDDLGVIPMRLLSPAERHDIQARLVSRGKKYRRICGRPHALMQHEGPVIALDQGTDWTWMVVIDGMAGRKMLGARVNDNFVTEHQEQSLKTFLSSQSHSMTPSGDPSSSRGGDPMSDDALPGAKGKQKSLEYEEAREDHQWTDIDYLTCPPMLVAFLLDENVWAKVHVENLTDIVWPGSPLDTLDLEVEKKELVQNLTRRFETKEVSEGSHQDTGEGQGGNLIIFLTGPPGVGKSLTAEVVAEETHRPFYRVSAGELGVDPSALEKQLGNVFLLARCWGAIILIDKADMFMAKRRASMPDQNAEVTAFLRLFHTYDGMLFLTSTSKDIDTAFYDRIHATIEYTELDETQRTNIWRRQLQRAIGSPEGHPPNSPWPEEAYRLLGNVETNGREIRNIVRTAEQLALGLNRTGNETCRGSHAKLRRLRRRRWVYLREVGDVRRKGRRGSGSSM
ncbi:hypothetical protein CGCF245_v008323 [Colletotrichum fructicola]|nr:hypothetical protein CGCF245_v008323 [Colletotrichum fructicola]